MRKYNYSFFDNSKRQYGSGPGQAKKSSK
jgi:hypothetical protein